MSQEITPENLTICVNINGKNYPTVGTVENMELFRKTVLTAMKACEINYTSKLGSLELVR